MAMNIQDLISAGLVTKNPVFDKRTTVSNADEHFSTRTGQDTPTKIYALAPSTFVTPKLPAVSACLVSNGIPAIIEPARVVRKTQPPLLWKAYAIAVASYLSNDNDLSASNKAVFLGSPIEAGLPGGKYVHNEIMNAELYKRMDPLQDYSTIFYESGDSTNGSSFEALKAYLSNHAKSLDQALSKAKQDRARAERKTITARDRADASFENASPEVKKLGRNAFFANDETLAVCEAEEERCTNAVANFDYGAMDHVQSRLQTMTRAELARDLIAGEVMRCSDAPVRSKIEIEKVIQEPLDRSTVYYRPLYSLSDYDITVDGWFGDSPNNVIKSKSLSLDHARKRSWASLGFPELDALPLDGNDLLWGSATFELRFIGIQPFNITRGKWDLNFPRYTNGVASPSPPQEKTEKPFLKIQKALLAYGVSLAIKVLQGVSGFEPTGAPLCLMDMPITSVENGVILLSSRRDGMNEYPRLLAILTKEW